MGDAHTILIVDDDEDIREALRDALDRGREHICVAHNGADALVVLRSVQVDLVILDLAMPGMCGREFLERRAADPRLATLPVIVVTALRDTTLDELDVFAVVHKPFELQGLRAVIDRARGATHRPRSRTVLESAVR
jgi:CheY-like chemotaxis protein